MACTLDGCLKQRTGYSLLYSFECFVVALCLADTDVGDTLVVHNSLNICEIQVDQCRHVDQVCDALYCLLQNFVCFLQCFRHCSTTVNDLKQFVVRDNDQSIYVVF